MFYINPSQTPASVPPIKTESEVKQALANPSPAPNITVPTPHREKCFVNDLTEQQKEEVLQCWIDQTRQTLAQPRITINTVAKLLGIEHRRAADGFRESHSFREFLGNRQSKLPKLLMEASRLTATEREALLRSLTK